MPRKSAKMTSEIKHSPIPPKAPPVTAAETKPPQAADIVQPAAVAPATPVASPAPETPKAPELVVAAVAKPVEQAVTRPVVEAVQTATAKSPAAKSASAADKHPAGKATSEATARLVAALRDPDADVAREAATSLGATGDKSAVQPLIEALRDVEGYFHCVVRAAAAHSLGQLGDPRAVEPLLSAVNDTMAEASAEAVRALAALGDRRAVPVLVEIVRNRDGFYLPSVRHAAVLALSRLGGGEAEAELTAAAHDPYENLAVRDAAEQALRNAGGTAVSSSSASAKS